MPDLTANRVADKERWIHGFNDWEWDKDIGCWVHKGPGNSIYYCLGDQMFHKTYGKTKHHTIWIGSYSDNWHGGIETERFSEALEWLKLADGKGHELW